MPAVVGELQRYRFRNFAMFRQCQDWQEGIIARIDEQGRHFDLFQPHLAAGPGPIILSVFEAMNRRGIEIIKFAKRGRSSYPPRIQG